MDKQLKLNLEEISLAISMAEYDEESGRDTTEYFDRNDDTVLLDLGFKYYDTNNMRGEVDGVMWWVDLEAKRAPVWTYSIPGYTGTSYNTYGRMPYYHVANALQVVAQRLKEKHGAIQISDKRRV